MSFRTTTLLLVTIVALLGPVLIAFISERTPRAAQRLWGAMAAQAMLMALTAFALWALLALQGRPPASLGLTPPTASTILFGLGLAVFFVYVFSPIAHAWLKRSGQLGFQKGLQALQEFPRWYLAFAVVVGGAAEEILYRGVAIAALTELTTSVGLAASLSVAVYFLAHVPLWGWWAAATTLASGSVLTAFYLAQGDLTACIIAHVVTDLVGIVLSARRREGATPQSRDR